MPDQEPRHAEIDATPESQRAFYEELDSYELAPSIRDEDGNIVSADYYQVDSIDGIDFYTPNDETWGAIIAVSNEHKIAHYTTFYEMDDMASPAPYDDYKMVIVEGFMSCKFDAAA